MEHSNEINELVAALAKAQGAMEAPTKDATFKGEKYSFKYATLDRILGTIREPFSTNGLWFIQSIDGETMVTRILHSSGQWIDCESPMIMPAGKKPQDMGSAMTYAKRYGLCMALGIAAEDDDDGNMANGLEVRVQTGGRRAAPKEAEPAPAWETYTRETYKAIKNASDLDEVHQILQLGGAPDPTDMPWILEDGSKLSEVKRQDAEVFGKIVDLVKKVTVAANATQAE